MEKREPSFDELTDYWCGRLQDATARHKAAIAQYREALEEYRTGTAPPVDGGFAFRQALRAETVARHEYVRILRIFTELILEGKIPEQEHSSGEVE